MSMWRISRFVFRSFSPRSSAAVSSVEAIDVGRVALCLALALALTLPAPGRTDAIEIAALESAARSGSPVLAAARARAREVLVLAEVAGLRGDPELALWVRNAFPSLTDTADRPVELEIEVVQPVRWPGKRGALEELAAAETQAALYEVEVAWVGDGNNVANSWIHAAASLGMKLRLACPEGYEPPASVLLQRKCCLQASPAFLGARWRRGKPAYRAIRVTRPGDAD